MRITMIQGLDDRIPRVAFTVTEAARALGMPPNPSLSDLASHAGEMWGEILTDHKRAFVSMTQSITALADTNRDLITSGYRAARETLLALGEATDGYAADGSAVMSPALAAPSRFDRKL